MKKIFTMFLMLLLFPVSVAWSAGSCVQSGAWEGRDASIYTVKFACTGDSSNGSIPNTALSSLYLKEVIGLYLFTVSAYPTSGGTAPDAADVFILDGNGEDMLGSADGGTTANKGANLIHATLKKTTYPYSYHSSAFWYPAINTGLTLKVASQATASANYTIELVFVR